MNERIKSERIFNEFDIHSHVLRYHNANETQDQTIRYYTKINTSFKDYENLKQSH